MENSTHCNQCWRSRRVARLALVVALASFVLGTVILVQQTMRAEYYKKELPGTTNTEEIPPARDVPIMYV